MASEASLTGKRRAVAKLCRTWAALRRWEELVVGPSAETVQMVKDVFLKTCRVPLKAPHLNKSVFFTCSSAQARGQTLGGRIPCLNRGSGAVTIHLTHWFQSHPASSQPNLIFANTPRQNTASVYQRHQRLHTHAEHFRPWRKDTHYHVSIGPRVSSPSPPQQHRNFSSWISAAHVEWNYSMIVNADARPTSTQFLLVCFVPRGIVVACWLKGTFCYLFPFHFIQEDEASHKCRDMLTLTSHDKLAYDGLLVEVTGTSLWS